MFGLIKKKWFTIIGILSAFVLSTAVYAKPQMEDLKGGNEGKTATAEQSEAKVVAGSGIEDPDVLNEYAYEEIYDLQDDIKSILRILRRKTIQSDSFSQLKAVRLRLDKIRRDWDDIEEEEVEDEMNFRGQATVVIRENVSSAYAGQCIRNLAKTVRVGDFEAIKSLVKVSSAYVASAIGAYFTNHLQRPRKNNSKCKVTAALVQRLNGAYVAKYLKLLPAYISPDDAVAVKKVINDINSAYIAKTIQAYFKNHTNRPRKGNHKHKVVSVLINHLNGAYVASHVELLPAYISSDDFIALDHMIKNTNTAYYKQRIREYYGLTKEK